LPYLKPFPECSSQSDDLHQQASAASGSTTAGNHSDASTASASSARTTATNNSSSSSQLETRRIGRIGLLSEMSRPRAASIEGRDSGLTETSSLRQRIATKVHPHTMEGEAHMR